MRFASKFFLLLVVWSNLCTALMAANIREVASSLAFPHRTTWEQFPLSEASYSIWVCNVIEGIRCGAARHISLAKREISAIDRSGIKVRDDMLFPCVFVSGQVREDVRPDIVGAVLYPNGNDFWNVFRDIGSSHFSCAAGQEQAYAHSERAACLHALTHPHWRGKKLDIRVDKLTLHIFNVKETCRSCKSFFRGSSKLTLGGKFSRTDGVSILDALREAYKVEGDVEIIVHSLEAEDFKVVSPAHGQVNIRA